MGTMVMIRTACLLCIPLYVLMSGYLMSEKRIPLQWDRLKVFYAGLIKVLVTYLLCHVVIFCFRVFWLHEDLMLRDCILFALGYGGYSWYVNMYIGLYLMIPLLNHLWHSLDSKESQSILLVILLALTVAPTVFNIWNLHMTGALLRPWIAENYDQLIPDWWTDLYPVAYYFVGAYIRRNVRLSDLPSGKIFCILVLSLLFSGLFNYWRCYSVCFIWGSWCSKWGLQNALNAVLVFLFLNSVRFKEPPVWLGKLLALVSGLTFGAYILSWIPDQVTYSALLASVPEVPDRVFYFPLYAGKTILISLLLSLFVHLFLVFTKRLLSHFSGSDH